MSDHHRAAPRQVGAHATAAAAGSAKVEVVQEALAASDGVGPLLRWRMDGDIVKMRDIARASERAGSTEGGREAMGPSHIRRSPIKRTPGKDKALLRGVHHTTHSLA